MDEEMNNVQPAEEPTQEVEQTEATEIAGGGQPDGDAPKGGKGKKTFGQKLDGFFGIKKNNSSVATEIVAGLVTFLTMAYILTLNPSLITNDWDHVTPLWSSVFIATALGAVCGTLLMALYAKMPLAQAPGLGLNSMVGTLLGGGFGFVCSFGNAMLLVLISGILFLLLSIIKIKGTSIREMIFDGIPEAVRGSIAVGIGLFIAFIGLWLSGIIVHPTTTNPLAVVDFTKWDMETLASPIVCIFGFIVIAVLSHFKVHGSVIIGILAATLLGIPLGVTQWSGQTWAFWEHFKNFFSFNSENGGSFFAAFTEGFVWEGGASVISCIMIVITFCMVDMFDTMGTVVGCCAPVNMLDKDGKPHNYNKIMLADSTATCAGALFGTSTVTTFVESGSGIAAGGRTGLTALTTAIMFLLSIFLLPLFASIPGAAADAALIYVGCLMLKGIKGIKLDSVKELVAAFLTIATMPLAYSITAGIGVGMLAYVIIGLIEYIVNIIKYAATKKKNPEAKKPAWELHVVTLIVAALFLVYFLVPTSFTPAV